MLIPQEKLIPVAMAKCSILWVIAGKIPWKKFGRIQP
jgi:hypothetical protein